MSKQVIRISSEQGFGEAWLNAAQPTTLNLCDFRIPRGLVCDLSKSYVSFNTQINPTVAGNFTSTDDPINYNLKINGLVTGNLAIEVPNTALIKNAMIDCDKGQIESIRRVDTLKSTLWNIEHDAEERKDDLNAFTAPKQARGDKNQTSFFLDPVIENVDDAGGIITGRDSRNLARDIKIPLKDIFGIGEAEDWDTDKFGETRIHLETNWKDVKSYVLGGAEDVTNSFDQVTPIKWGQCDDIAVGANPDSTSAVVLTFTYDDFQLQCPFFVGQHIFASATTSNADPNPANVSAVIQKMEYNPQTAKMTLTFTAPWYTNGQAGPSILSDVLIKADNSSVVTNTVNRAELVLFTKPGMTNTEDSYEYVTYSTEQDNGNGITSFARGYVMEPMARNMIVALCPNGEKLPTTDYESYRYAVNNEAMTGNRDIEPDTPLQYDRLTRSLDSTGMGLEWRNAQLRWFNNEPGTLQALSYAQKTSVIAETLMMTDRQKYVDLQIECAGGLNEIIIYKQHVRSI